MTPKEKAIELVNKYWKIGEEEYQDTILNWEESKQCALIAVDEILETCYLEKEWFFEEVKQEIENL